MSQSQGRVEEYYSTVIVKGLKAALAESSIDGPLSKFPDSHIKLNKLMYMAAAEHDLLDELQHSWHIYGSDLGDLVPSTQSVRPIAIQQLPRTQSPNEPSLDQFSNSLYDEERFYEFFMDVSIGDLNSLEEILEANRVDLLEEFYERYSQEIGKFYDLYSYNLKLQRLLEYQQERVDVANIGELEYKNLNEFTQRMRDEFFEHEEFQPEMVSELGLDLQNEISTMFTEFLTLTDDVFFSLSRKEPSDIHGDASHIISELKSFYLNQTWKAVTEVISFHTIRGPRRGSLEYGAKAAIENVDNNYQVKFDRLLSECASANVLPDDSDESGEELLSPEESLEMLESSELLNH